MDNKFVELGIFQSLDAVRVIERLEEVGIPVKEIVPGSEMGTDMLFNARTGYTFSDSTALLVPESDIDKAKKLLDELGVEILENPIDPTGHIKPAYKLILQAVVLIWLVGYVVSLLGVLFDLFGR